MQLIRSQMDSSRFLVQISSERCVGSTLLKKIKPRLQLLKDDQLRDQILTDIHELQRCQSQPIFHAATKLFQDKYKDKGDRVTDFLEYFKSEWLVQQPNWYEGYLVPILSRYIRAEHKQRTRV